MPGAPNMPNTPTGDDMIAEARRRGQSGSGGGGGPICEPPPLEIFVQADDKLNPNKLGQPTPVEVRALLLRERGTFDTLDFETVWKNTAQALSKDLVTSASLTVYPGKLKIYPMKSAWDVAYVALVALFQEPQGRSWKYVIDVKSQNRRCADREELHTMIHAVVSGSQIGKPTE